MLYIKIKSRGGSRGKKKENIIMRLILFFLELIIPKANPDFDNKIDLVAYWLLEFVDKHTTPDREIGLGVNEEVIMKMPYKENYGYWVDNNLTFEDFHRSFEILEVTKEYFVEKWEVGTLGEKKC